MTGEQRTTSGDERAAGPLRRLSLWFQRTTNARTVTRVRRKGGRMMGMDVLILHTTGRRSGAHRESPLAWFADGENSWLIIASGGGDRHPDRYANLMANPEDAAIEFSGSQPRPVRPHRLDGPDYDRAWSRIVREQPRYEKYQRRSDRRYPLVRLTAV
ncbi:nitroreductase family deazaflavin-dependent oxidoreductase [Nocardia higoensis]|uniref:Nitroreductase family deazaflavin-dependent oxidoreductase n=1 Tax=Nocardia higoensis TaxID=228599 RepID=A0ABS0D5X8_9NOCA|nr:nitroreductase family deazaflavin-dependent oxidoreductase [Nocardia higoensis]MBF6353880.1 nitroreductase family deazaflavin-dependent oxidoreductase [Nocardia higoensis]